MATSSFFYGGSTAPEQNTVDELIDALNAATAAADEDRVDAEIAAQQAAASAANATLSEQNAALQVQQAAGLLSSTQAAANTALTSASNSAASAGSAALSATTAASSASAAAISASQAASSAAEAGVSSDIAAAAASNPYVVAVGSDLAGSGWTYDLGLVTDPADPLGGGTTPGYIETVAENIDDVTTVAANIDIIGDAATAAADAAASASAAAASQSAAATSASNAASSATAAATSATSSASSATASQASRVASEAARDAAVVAQNAAQSSQSAAAASASSASSSASAASGSASAAAGSATTASNAVTAAQAAQAAAEAVYDNFDDRYLGAKASAPTVDNDGNALIAGALYFNSTIGQMYVWSGSAWGVIGSNPDSVVGPASSTDNAIARFDGTTGKLVQNSTATVSDTGDAVFKSVNFNDPVHGSRTLSMSSGRLVVDGDFDTVGTYRFGNGWCSLSGGNADGVTLAQLSNGTGNFVLQPNSTGIVEARNGTNPIRFRIYNTFTDASNYERGFMRWNTNAFQIGTEKAGTGSPRNIELVRDGSVVGSIYESYGNIFEFYGTLQSSRVVASGPGDFTIIGYQAAAGLNGAFVSSAGLVGWGSTANPNNGVDTALARDSAGVVKVTNGSTGLGVLKASSLDIDTFDLGVLP